MNPKASGVLMTTDSSDHYGVITIISEAKTINTLKSS